MKFRLREDVCQSKKEPILENTDTKKEEVKEDTVVEKKESTKKSKSKKTLNE